mmetsp:Transcript_2417/g.4409  ORF Transcript_2417/g.4409 Transcript_2417/m.4409 type:complete len:90 (-) Transcript_2417:766-1035(-)
MSRIRSLCIERFSVRTSSAPRKRKRDGRCVLRGAVVHPRMESTVHALTNTTSNELDLILDFDENSYWLLTELLAPQELQDTEDDTVPVP